MFYYNKMRNPILWTRASEAIYHVIRDNLSDDPNIIEVGSGTGHISYFLAMDGHQVTLNDIRDDSLKTSVDIYKRHGVLCQTIYGDLFKIEEKFEFLWNSGLIQCVSGSTRTKLVQKLAKISPRVLLFYPDTDSKEKIKGSNKKKIPGVDDAVEYSVKDIPSLMNNDFEKVSLGEINAERLGLPYKMYFVLGENSV